jgi:hypothetical protein
LIKKEKENKKRVGSRNQLMVDYKKQNNGIKLKLLI